MSESSTPTTAMQETQRAFQILSALPPDVYATIFKEADLNEADDLTDLLRMLFHDAVGRIDAPVDRMAEGMAYILTGDSAHVLGEPAGTPTAGDDEGEALRLIADLPPEARKWIISTEPDEGDPFGAELPSVLDHSISNMRSNGVSVAALARAACFLARSMTGEAADLPAAPSPATPARTHRPLPSPPPSSDEIDEMLARLRTATIELRGACSLLQCGLDEGGNSAEVRNYFDPADVVMQRVVPELTNLTGELEIATHWISKRDEAKPVHVPPMRGKCEECGAERGMYFMQIPADAKLPDEVQEPAAAK